MAWRRLGSFRDDMLAWAGNAQVVVGRKLDDIYMVMEYMEHDLKALQESMRQPFAVSEVAEILNPNT